MCASSPDWLRQTPNVWPVLVAEGWPKNEAILQNAKALVVYADGGIKLPFLAPQRWGEQVKSLVNHGASMVMLHQSVDIPAEHSDEVTVRGSAARSSRISAAAATGIMELPATSPRTRPCAASPRLPHRFDGWLYNLHFAPGVTPMLRGAVRKSRAPVPMRRLIPTARRRSAWAYQRPAGGRSFAFTGCDLHRNWSIEERQRRLVVNGILWSAGVEVPAEGAPAVLGKVPMNANLDTKPAKTPAAEKPAAPVAQ